MRISSELADQIQAKAHSILQREILVADSDGLVMAGNSAKGQFVPDALKASQEGRQIQSEHDSHPIKWCPFVYEEQTIGVFGVLLDSGPLTPEAVSLLQGLAEVIVHQHMLLDKLQSTEVVRSGFIRDLLQAQSITAEEIYRQADILQLNLHTAQAVMLIHLKDFETTMHPQLAHLSSEEQRLELQHATDQVVATIREAFDNFPGNIVSYIEKDTFVLLKGMGGENLNTLNTIRFLQEKAKYIHDVLTKLQQKGKVTVGVGQYYHDLGGLRKSYQDAKLALSVGSKVWGHGLVYHIKEVGMYTSLANISQDRKAELAHQILSPLLRNQQLFKTVQTFLSSDLNLTDAANKLHVHRNTLIYRLDKTKKLIGLDPRHFDDALQIKLGLMFYQPV